MKTKERKQSDLEALTENFKNSDAAMVLSFTRLTVDKDQQFRNEIREAGAKYGVVKNTLARLAVKGTPFEEATEHFNGVTSVAWTEGEPVGLSKVISKYIKAEKGVFEFKTGIVDGKVIAYDDVETIASLPSKDELIAKLLYLINAPAQRLATVLSAIPRDLAAVVKQVSEREVDEPAAEEAPAEAKPEAKQEKEPKESDKAEPAEGAEEKDSKEAEKTEAPEEEGDAKAEPDSDSGKEEIKEDESSEKEDKSKDEDASTEKEASDKESDSEGEGGGEPAGDESK